MADSYDILCVGAGLSALIFAERCANVLNKKCLVIDKRTHIGGNCYDYEDKNTKINIHKYGPHYFRTNSKIVLDYLSNFTKWNEKKFIVKTFTHNKIWDFPINLNTIKQIKTINQNLSPQEIIKKIKNFDSQKNSSLNAEDFLIKKVGNTIYNSFYKNYTKKQWGHSPRKLNSSVVSRIPIRLTYENNFLNEKFQALPKNGYAEIFKNLINSSKNIQVLLNTSFEEIKNKIQYKFLVYSGMIDEYYDYFYGELPYRSLQFKKETLSSNNNENYFYQKYPQINYPNHNKYTRILEYKHFMKNFSSNKTVIVKEFPQKYNKINDAFYPIPNVENQNLYKKYYSLSQKETKILFIGRLANYKYINMDQAIYNSLNQFKKIKSSL